MDSGLAWTIAGSVAGGAGAIFAGAQLWQAHRDGRREPGPHSPLPGQVTLSGSKGAQVGQGNLQVNQFLAPPADDGIKRSEGLVVVGEIPQEPPGWRPRPELMAALETPGHGSRTVVRAMTGMLGVGKTQLAAAFARARLADGGWRLVAWISAETRDSVLAGLAAAAEAISLAAPDAHAAGLVLRHWLEANGAGCLLVFDNVTDPEMIQPYMPVAGAAQVIITSNQQSVARLGAPVGVGVFTDTESLSYLRERTYLDDQAAAQQLGWELGWLPLALAQAAAVIATQRLDYATYLQRLRQMPVAQLLAPVTAGQYPRGLAAAVLLSLEATTGEDASGTRMATMDLLAVLSRPGSRAP